MNTYPPHHFNKMQEGKIMQRKSKKVYVLTCWTCCYECGGETNIEGVFETREKAEAFAKENFGPLNPWEEKSPRESWGAQMPLGSWEMPIWFEITAFKLR